MKDTGNQKWGTRKAGSEATLVSGEQEIRDTLKAYGMKLGSWVTDRHGRQGVGSKDLQVGRKGKSRQEAWQE